MSVSIVIRFPDETAAALKAERIKSGVPTNEYVRRAVTASFHRPHASDYWKPSGLHTNERLRAKSIERGEFTPGGKSHEDP
jgi:hypothetical protein